METKVPNRNILANAYSIKDYFYQHDDLTRADQMSFIVVALEILGDVLDRQVDQVNMNRDIRGRL